LSKALTPKDVLRKNSKYKVSVVKSILLKYGIKEYVCEDCGISDWRGNKIVLHLHHVDGDRSNNDIRNLKFLCPNCHSLTESYCLIKNYKIDEEELKKIASTSKNMSEILNVLGLPADGGNFYRLKSKMYDLNIRMDN
jgi:5-methylcytosine-specific restriction endonuclease McrA